MEAQHEKWKWDPEYQWEAMKLDVTEEIIQKAALQGIPLAEIPKQIGMSKNRFTRILRGTTDLTLFDFAKISCALGLNCRITFEKE